MKNILGISALVILATFVGLMVVFPAPKAYTTDEFVREAMAKGLSCKYVPFGADCEPVK